MQANGSAKKTHDVIVKWNPETQQIQIDFDLNEFKTWDMLAAILEMAKTDVDFRGKVARSQSLQAAQAQAAQDAIIKSKLGIRG